MHIYRIDSKINHFKKKIPSIMKQYFINGKLLKNKNICKTWYETCFFPTDIPKVEHGMKNMFVACQRCVSMTPYFLFFNGHKIHNNH